MTSNSFSCIDAHTCGNPVRVVFEGQPELDGATASERRQDFLARYDWIRTGLMFEPRGHDMMSGGLLYPPTRDDCDLGIVFIETSGCLPMCGHGTIGIVTVAIERGLATPRESGVLRLDTPAGVVEAVYRQEGKYVEAVRFRNVPAFLHGTDVEIDCPGLGALRFDIAYGGNFYAIADPQPNFADVADLSPGEIVRLSPIVRRLINEVVTPVHPEDPTIRGVSHVMWTGRPITPGADGRNAVFYGDKAIDRSPCGTGTSARMAQLAARGELSVGDAYVHESIIGSRFTGRVEDATKVGNHDAIVPSIEGWARITGVNTITIDDRDPYAHGFQVV
jgi:4-hydroxyproline epimerase